jgi:hypothetical protein
VVTPVARVRHIIAAHCRKLKRKGVEEASNVITFLPRFVEISHLLQKLKGHNDKEKQDGNAISVLLLRNEIRLTASVKIS